MWRVAEGMDVIIRIKSGQHFYFSKYGVIAFGDLVEALENGAISQDVLKNMKIWYLSDGKPDQRVVALSRWFVIVISSPKEENFARFEEQESARGIYVKPWTWEEIFATA